MGTLFEVIKPLLFRMPPEDAHHLTVGLLTLVQRVPFALTAVEALFKSQDAPVTVAGVRFRNPVGLAAGFDKNAEVIAAMGALGFGFVEVGTVTRHAQPGNPKPRMFRYPAHHALVNRLGFNNVGVVQARRNLEHARRPAGLVVGINVGKSAVTALEDAPDEYAWSLNQLRGLGDYYTLNISSPNTKDLRLLHQPDRLERLLDLALNALAGAGPAPLLFLKVSPDAQDEQLVTVATLASSRGVGLIATNTTVQRDGFEGMEAGGLSGAPLHDRSVQVLKLLRSATGGRVPLMGVGGVLTPQDAVGRMHDGANLIQVYTGLVYGGPGVVKAMVGALATQGEAA